MRSGRFNQKAWPIALFALLSFACSSEQPGPTGGADPLRNEALFCSAWAEAACNDEVVDACNGTAEGCRETQRSQCLVVVPPGYISKHAQACLDAVEVAYEDAELTAGEIDIIRNLAGPCADLVKGPIAEGEGCTESFDCDAASGFRCVVKPGEATGTCELPVEVGGGRSCAAAASVCAVDFYCAASAQGSSCLERLGVDDPCDSDDACQPQFRCLAPAMTCQPRLPNGEPCVADVECESHLCVETTAGGECYSEIRLSGPLALCDELR